MTDRSAALMALLNASTSAGLDFGEHALDDFYGRFEGDPLVVDKWFAFQAMQRGTSQRPTVEIVRALMSHPAFNIRNPNRVRALIFSFCGANPAQFHAADGSGYAFWAEQVVALDAFEPAGCGTTGAHAREMACIHAFAARADAQGAYRGR